MTNQTEIRGNKSSSLWPVLFQSLPLLLVAVIGLALVIDQRALHRELRELRLELKTLEREFAESQRPLARPLSALL